MAQFTKEQKEAFIKKMEKALGEDSKVQEEAAEESPKPKEYFPTEKKGKLKAHHQWFSKLFFDPKEIGKHDFQVLTYFHEAESWPEWVKASVPSSDPHYQWNKAVTYAFVLNEQCLLTNEEMTHAFLVGMPGSGKTTLPFEVAAKTGRPVFKQSFREDLEPDEWILSKEIDSTGTHWKTLRFVETLSFPFYCVLDEFNRLRRGGRLEMNRLLDTNGTMQLRDGTEVKPHPKWRAVATDNTRGLGDGLAYFAGDVADISTTDRFGVMYEVGYLPLEQQVELVMAWFPNMHTDLANKLVQFGAKAAIGFKQDSLPLPFTPRRLKRVAQSTMLHRNPIEGIREGYYNFMAEDKHRQVIDKIVKDVGFPKEFGNLA